MRSVGRSSPSTRRATPKSRIGLALGGDEDVLGLQVAMHDALRVRVLHRVGDAREHGDAISRRRHALGSPAPEGHTVHELHHEIGRGGAPFAGLARVEHARDAGMVEPREDRGLALEPPAALGVQRLRVDAFHGVARTVLAVLLRQIHFTHAATAEKTNRPVWPDALRQRLLTQLLDRLAQSEPGFERRAAAALEAQQLVHLGTHGGVGGAALIEERGALGLGQRQRGQEDGLDAPVARRVGRGIGGHELGGSEAGNASLSSPSGAGRIHHCETDHSCALRAMAYSTPAAERMSRTMRSLEGEAFPRPGPLERLSNRLVVSVQFRSIWAPPPSGTCGIPR
ncbi:MAG: hypothetical protein IPJ04_03880 [Candidatus Eisenbacteria bacterium]|nr:hypothetical protein [Candidatus Eisenbacteria bacterium]